MNPLIDAGSAGAPPDITNLSFPPSPSITCLNNFLITLHDLTPYIITYKILLLLLFLFFSPCPIYMQKIYLLLQELQLKQHKKIQTSYEWTCSKRLESKIQTKLSWLCMEFIKSTYDDGSNVLCFFIYVQIKKYQALMLGIFVC